MFINPTREQIASFGTRRATIERDHWPEERYELIAIDSYATDELIEFFYSISAPGKYHIGYCDENDGRIIAYRTVKNGLEK